MITRGIRSILRMMLLDLKVNEPILLVYENRFFYSKSKQASCERPTPLLWNVLSVISSKSQVLQPQAITATNKRVFMMFISK